MALCRLFSVALCDTSMPTVYKHSPLFHCPFTKFFTMILILDKYFHTDHPENDS